MSARPREFLDTNVLVYAFSVDPKSTIAEAVLARGRVVGLQGLNEFANVARRKLKMTWLEIRQALTAIRALCPTVAPLDIETHEAGLGLAERLGFSAFDALMVAAALRAGCDVFWSEDLQKEMMVDGTLRIRNPFDAGTVF
jgi:predicted nucleic acid-binding protein